MAELVRSARAAAVCSLLLFAGCKEPPPRATSTSAPPVSPAKPYRELAARQNKPRALTAAGASLFWINEGGLEKYQPGVAPAGLMRVAIAGGAVERIADVAPDAALAADGDTLYFTDRKAGALYALAQTGGAPHTLARGLAEPSALAVDEAAVYVLTGSSVALANEKPASLDGGKLTPARAELTDARDGAVWRVPKRGGKAAAIVTQLPLASGLELDGERLYIRTFFGGRLLAAAKAGGATRVVVEEPRQWATWLADRGGVFWSTMDLDPVVRGLINAASKRWRGRRSSRGASPPTPRTSSSPTPKACAASRARAAPFKPSRNFRCRSANSFSPATRSIFATCSASTRSPGSARSDRRYMKLGVWRSEMRVA